MTFDVHADDIGLILSCLLYLLRANDVYTQHSRKLCSPPGNSSVDPITTASADDK
jgi:hypothetical protein